METNFVPKVSKVFKFLQTFIMTFIMRGRMRASTTLVY
jgi:hypothetical protein